MTVRKYSSISQETTLTSALNSSATTMVVGSATALLSGISLSAGETFTVVIDPDTALEEIVDVIAPSSTSSNTLTVVREVDSTAAISHSAGAKVRHMAIGRDFRDANSHINNVTTAHGLTIANVLETTDTNMITTDMLQSNAVTTAKITDANVTTAKIADSNVTTAKIADSNVTTAKIADLNVTTGKIADSAITSAKIADGTIVAGDIADGAITSAKILNGTIATDDIADSAITTAKIAAGAVATVDIADSAVTTAKVADSAITSAKIADGTIVAGDLADGAVTSAKILDGTIVNADVSATAAIAKTKLDLGGTITSADLVDGTIVNADINASAAIALSKLAVDPLARANHTGSQTASTISDFDTQVRTSKVTDLAAPTGALSMNNQKITNLAPAVGDGDAVSVDWIDSQKGANNGIAPLDTNGKVPLDHIPATAIAEVFVVSSESAMLSISGVGVGDIAIRSDLNKSFILRVTPGTTLSNWNELLTPIDAVLSVDGQTGAVSLSSTYLNRTTGQLLGNLNANTHTITNLGAPTNANDAATKTYVDAVAGTVADAEAAAAAAEAAYDSFDDRYLGAKSTPPTLDNDGSALVTGAIYWNSVTNQMFAWTGSAWGSISSTADIYRFRYTAAGGETTESGPDDNGLTLSYIPGKEQVYLNGVLLARTSDYNATNGTSITGLAALTAGDILEVITFTAFELADAIARSVLDAKGDLIVATSADTPGRLALGTDGHYLQADSSTATGLKWSAVSGYSAPTLGSTTIASGATVTTISGLTLAGPTLSGTVTASGDINLSAAGAVGSINDEFALLTMGAI
jgi:hypothetical protein